MLNFGDEEKVILDKFHKVNEVKRYSKLSQIS